VAIDRHAVILYKRALDRVIAHDLARTEGLAPDEALQRAEAMSRPVYSTAQDDGKPSEDLWVDAMRADLRRHALDEGSETKVIGAFADRGEPPHFLIVCNKLLTGFDAPLESVMYLDSPLKDHNLLQAIARTNRVSGEKKTFGLIVDYIGVTKKLDEALEAYREEDVENAMRDLEVERDALSQAHRELFALIPGVRRHTGDLSAEYDALLAAVGGDEAMWYQFRRKADAFVRAYESLSPDPAILDYQKDLKWVVGAIQYLTPFVEKEVPPDLSGVSGKIRQLLEQHLDVTGLRTVVTVRQLTDPEFQDDFDLTDKTPQELRRATIRKATELKRITYDKKQQNPLRYETFSERVLEVIRRFEQNQLEAAEALKAFEEITEDLRAEDRAHESSGLNERAYGVLKILESLAGDEDGSGEGRVREGQGDGAGAGGTGPDRLKRLAEEIDDLYGGDATAPAGWHLKDQLRRELRSQVRYRAHQAGIREVREVSARVEDYALRHYVRVS
jgi:type I restriction enzyme R subunit